MSERASRTDGPRHDWEELGVREPWFAVLSEPRFLRENLDDEALAAFDATGEADVSRFLDLAGIERVDRALELGCGVGRLTIPMARRAAHVIGVDAAPSLLRLAEEAAATREVLNVEFRPVDELELLDHDSFDLVYSYIVFQHIPVREGERLFHRLLELTAQDGVAILHFTTSRPGGPIRRMLRRLRAESRAIHRLASLARGEGDLPYMQMNEYDERRVEAIFREHGFQSLRREPTDHGGISGALFIARR